MPIDPRGLRARARVLHAVRTWFHDHGYLEIPTPALVASAGMETHLHPLSAADGLLRTSPEFALKRVVAAGLPRIYEIGPCFRDRERGGWHGREFTMLEWYRAGAELSDLMDEVKGLVAAAAAALDVPTPDPWRRIDVRALVREVTGIDLATVDAEALGGVNEGWDDAFFRLWVSRVEPTLTDPVFVDEWPASQAALARIVDRPGWPVAGRFEVFLGGVELANAFFELGDATEQRRRFASSNAERMVMGEQPHPVDEAFVEAVGRLPRCAGIALGIDRLVAALCGWQAITPGRVETT
ncbi:MAG: EF-P lysine aminoacylase GenX [Deltaproteobacteria bacterium]|nr:EF-P lysine aminoacylase GenX [Deltaproteobacteria bacterium]